jgi:hypothetical protein
LLSDDFGRHFPPAVKIATPSQLALVGPAIAAELLGVNPAIAKPI